MELTLKIAGAALRKLEKLASASGQSLEEAAQDLLVERVADAPDKPTRTSKRWSYNGIPWDRIPVKEQDRLHREGYEKFPVQTGEFEWAPEDEIGFASGE